MINDLKFDESALASVQISKKNSIVKKQNIEISKPLPVTNQKADEAKVDKRDPVKIEQLAEMFNSIATIQILVNEMLKENELKYYCSNVCNQAYSDKLSGVKLFEIVSSDPETIINDPRIFEKSLGTSMISKMLPPEFFDALSELLIKKERGLLDNIGATFTMHKALFNFKGHIEKYTDKDFKKKIKRAGKMLDEYKAIRIKCGDSILSQDESIKSCEKVLTEFQAIYELM